MKVSKILLISILCFVFCSNTSLVFARDVNGVTVTDFRTSLIYGQHIDHFTSFNPTTSGYIYNETGGFSATSGEVSLRGLLGSKTLVISVPTLGSTSLDFRLEGKVGTAMTTWSNIFTKNVASATTSNTDIIIPISEYITSYRLGVKTNTNGTDVINCSTSAVAHR